MEQVSKIYDMTVAQQKERQLKAEGLSNDMATSGSDGYLRFAEKILLIGKGQKWASLSTCGSLQMRAN